MRTRYQLGMMSTEKAHLYLEVVGEVQEFCRARMRVPPAGVPWEENAYVRGYNQAMRDVLRHVHLREGGPGEGGLDTLFLFSEALIFAHAVPKVYHDPQRDEVEIEFSAETGQPLSLGRGVILFFGKDTGRLVKITVRDVRGATPRPQDEC